MRIDGFPPAQRAAYFDFIRKRVKALGEPVWIKYLDLGVRVARLINYSPELDFHINIQLAWSLRDHADHYDTTIVLWRDYDTKELSMKLLSLVDPWTYRRNRLLQHNIKKPSTFNAKESVDPDLNIVCFENTINRHHPLIRNSVWRGDFVGYDPDNNIHYYALSHSRSEDFRVYGHVMSLVINNIVDTENSNVIHAGIFGINNTGVMIAGPSGQGKTTLAISALLNGFEFVSDDQSVISNQDGILKAWPIYSFCDFSHDLYQVSYHKSKAKFISNNINILKYKCDISPYHDQFRTAYPVKLCMCINKTNNKSPQITNATLLDKQILFEQLAHSTLLLMSEQKNALKIGKIYDFIKNLKFYRFDLTYNIDKNIQYLKKFMQTQ